MKPAPPVSPASIHAAKLAAQIERDRIYQLTGLRITDDGSIEKGQPDARLHPDAR